jgi:type IV pilus assembly protein PilC
MAQFACRVALPSGEVVERSFVAEDEPALRRDLESKDVLLLEIRKNNPLAEMLADTFRFKARISAREFLFFNQELSALLKSGLPVLQSLDILLERRKNQVFKRALTDIRERVKGGEALSDAFAAQGNLFPRLYSASLASGERSGELPSVLIRYIVFSRNVLAIRRKVVSALIYPAILLLLSIGLIALMVFYIIPKFNDFLKDFGAELPLLTEVLVNTATFCRANWVVIVLGVVAVFAALGMYVRTDAGRLVFDKLKLRLPLVGKVVHDYAQNRFTRTLGTLVAGGIPLVVALELSARAVGNSHFESQLLAVTNKVREGQPLWESLEKTGLISDIAIQMIKVGESTGALEEMLNNASDFTDEEIDYKLTQLVAIVEPLMLVFMAVVVGGMLLAIYLPLLRTYSQMRA